MDVNPVLGVILHAIGGLAAASFYIPFRKVRNWSWETYWLTQGFAAWIVMPWLFAAWTIPDLWSVLADSSARHMFWSYFFGVLWGIGGLTFGLSMRFLGLSLGISLALGFCAAFGTIIPPIYAGTAGELFFTMSGLIVLLGVMACLGGISVCCYAGMLKERELTDEQKKQAIKEFALTKGFAVAVFAGVMSACMAFALDAGIPIAKAALDAGARDIFQNNPVFIFAMGGGFTTNLVWCLYLNFKNKSLKNYVSVDGGGVLAFNYLLAVLGGTIWYMQFFFYGMGTTRMGHYHFASWSIHMAFIIIFSNMWGLIFKEWKNVRQRTYNMVFLGLFVLVLSVVIIGYANYLKAP